MSKDPVKVWIPIKRLDPVVANDADFEENIGSFSGKDPEKDPVKEPEKDPAVTVFDTVRLLKFASEPSLAIWIHVAIYAFDFSVDSL